MPKLPIVSARIFLKVLKKKGFVHHRTSGSHHVYIRQSDQTTVSVPVHVGHDLGRGLLGSLLKNAGIPVDEFLRLK